MKFLFQKTGANLNKVLEEVDRLIETYPKVEGADKQYLTPDANSVLQQARKLMKEFGDQYISIELLIMGILAGRDPHNECLDLSGRWPTTENSKRIIVVVLVGGVLDGREAPYGLFGSVRKLVDNSKSQLNLCVVWEAFRATGMPHMVCL